MGDFSKLDHEMRCYALVGRFLNLWSKLEIALREALATGLRLNDAQTLVIAANVQFRDKLRILLGIIDLSNLSPKIKADFAVRLDKLATYSTFRNTVAHEAFEPYAQGVSFFLSRAKSKKKGPKQNWTVKRFKLEYVNIEAHTMMLKSISITLGTADLTRAYAAALAAPKVGFFGLGFGTPPLRLGPGLLDSLGPTLLEEAEALLSPSPKGVEGGT